MDKTYTKLDFGKLIDFEWPTFKNYCRVDDAGIWLLGDDSPELRGLADTERDIFLEHPYRDANRPVLPFPFTMDEFLKFAMLPAFEMRDLYTSNENTIDVQAIERLERMHAPAGALARALMFGELPKLATPTAMQGETASAYAEPVVTASASDGVEPDKAAPLNDELKTLAGRELLGAFSETVNNGAPLDWRYWVSQLPTLTTAEAARLMCGLDPDLFKSLESRPNENDQSNPCKKAAMIQRLAEREGKKSATPGEWISWAGEHQIAVHDGFRLEVESEPAKTTATPAPVVADKRREKKPSIESVAFDYMRKEYQSGQFQSSAKFHKHLIKTAGLDKSPFEMGWGTNARKLFCPAASSFFEEGTLGKMWAKIRAV